MNAFLNDDSSITIEDFVRRFMFVSGQEPTILWYLRDVAFCSSTMLMQLQLENSSKARRGDGQWL
jgi:hypothetical protein